MVTACLLPHINIKILIPKYEYEYFVKGNDPYNYHNTWKTIAKQKEEEHHLSTRASCLTYSLSHLIFEEGKKQPKTTMQAADKKATNDGKLIKIDTQNLITRANTTANREKYSTSNVRLTYKTQITVRSQHMWWTKTN